jgi:hypothetical protein
MPKLVKSFKKILPLTKTNLQGNSSSQSGINYGHMKIHESYPPLYPWFILHCSWTKIRSGKMSLDLSLKNKRPKALGGGRG